MKRCRLFGHRWVKLAGTVDALREMAGMPHNHFYTCRRCGANKRVLRRG